jgi:hypothetical protein
MPRRPKPLNPYASWTALLGATVQRLRLGHQSRPVLSQDELGRRISYDGSTVGAVERGVLRPDAKFIEACERELAAGGVLQFMFARAKREWEEWDRLGARPPIAGPLPAELADDPAQLQDADFLEGSARAVGQSDDGGQVNQTPRLHQGALEGVQRAVDRLRREYSSIRPAVLLPRAELRLAQLDGFLEGRLTLAEHRELLVTRGWLSLLMAALQFDLGDREAAEISRDAAHSLGREADHQEIVAWAFETPAWFALADHRLHDAVDLARAGQQVAPADRSVLVATTLQEARAWAPAEGGACHPPGRGRAGEAPGADRPAGPLCVRPTQGLVLPGHLLCLAPRAAAGRGARPPCDRRERESGQPQLVADQGGHHPDRAGPRPRPAGPDRRGGPHRRRRAFGGLPAPLDSWRAGELDSMLCKGHAGVAEVEDFHEQYVLARRRIEHTATGS